MSRAIDAAFLLLWGLFFWLGILAGAMDYRDGQMLRACAWALLAAMNAGFVWRAAGGSNDAK